MLDDLDGVSGGVVAQDVGDAGVGLDVVALTVVLRVDQSHGVGVVDPEGARTHLGAIRHLGEFLTVNEDLFGVGGHALDCGIRVHGAHVRETDEVAAG